MSNVSQDQKADDRFFKLYLSRWRWMTLALCLTSWLLGMSMGNIIGSGKNWLYYGPDRTKYENAWIGFLTE